MLSWTIGIERLKYEAKGIMKLAKKITKEAEYLHRREVREIRNRVLEVDRKQDRTIRGLEDSAENHGVAPRGAECPLLNRGPPAGVADLAAASRQIHTAVEAGQLSIRTRDNGSMSGKRGW